MTDIFKVPSIPIEDEKPTETPNTSTIDDQPELPPVDSVPPIRHKNLQYTVPDSSGFPPYQYTLEVIRNGAIIDYVALSQRAYTVFGRSPDSDVVLEHPTISRYHAIIQYKSEYEHGQPAGLYLYDCGSTHGTFINKKRLESKVYIRLKVGYLIKFGQSTRLYIVQGDSSAEQESNISGTGDDITHEQMKQFHAKRAKALAAVRAKRENMVNETNDNGAEMDWGMGPDIDEVAMSEAAIAEAVDAQQRRQQAEEEEATKKLNAVNDMRNRIEYQKAKNDQNILKEIMSRVSRNLFSLDELMMNLSCFLFQVDEPGTDDDPEKSKEPFYLKDPKRALTTFFEREGAELVYDVEDHQFGSYRCTIKLPIADELGRSIQAECEEKHCKRKEIIQKCILEACRLLDEHGVLRDGTAASATATPRIQQIKRQLLADNDFYEDDEDTFYDRTGDLEKKRLKRMEWSGHVNPETPVETFESLSEKLKRLYEEQVDLEEKLRLAKEMEENAAKNAQALEKEIDEVDLYIRQLKQGEKINMKTKWQWKKRLLEIENEERQWIKLFKVCKPKELEIPSWRQKIRDEAKEKVQEKKPTLPLPPVIPKPVIEIEPTPLPSETPSVIPKPHETPSIETKPQVRRKTQRRVHSTKDQFDDSDHYSEEKFSGWMPPDDQQTGDGRTALNDKYGY